LSQEKLRTALITGASKRIGRAIAEDLSANGFAVALHANQSLAEAAEIVAKLQRAGRKAIAIKADLQNFDETSSLVERVTSALGPLDLLVNNAGYGYLAAIEEGDDEGVRKQFETNLFGLIDVTKEILPGMRARRSGHIVNISSLGGLVAFAATGYYHATKFAVEAISESLSYEVAPLGLKVTIVEPGAFRTNWAGSSMVESPISIDDYDDTAGKRRQSTKASSGNQPGDPSRAAAAIIKAVEAEAPPLRLLLGAPALDIAYKRLDALRANFDAWKDVTLSADFPAHPRN